MSVTAPAVLYESSPTSVASGQQRQVQGTADGKVVISGTITATPATVGAGVGASAARTIEASDSPVTTALGAVGDAAVTNPASLASIISALKGLLTNLGVTNINGDALFAAETVPGAHTLGLIYNGATWDRVRGNQDLTLLASAARTVDTASADQTNFNGRGLKVVLDMTVVGTGSVTLTIQGKDALSGKYYTLLAGAAVTTNGTNVYTVFSGATAAVNAVANDILPRTWRVNVVANNANAATYSVGASVIL